MMGIANLRAFSLTAAVITLAGAASEAAGPGGGAPQQGAEPPRLTLRRLVDPASRIEVQGRHIQFAPHGLVRFDTLSDLFAYIDAEAGRWTFDSAAARAAFANGLMRRGVESRVVSMDTELPLEVLLTHLNQIREIAMERTR